MTKSLGYKDAIRFLNQFDNITYPEFDYYSVTNINLFTSLEAVDFKEIDGHITEIEKTLGAIKRIFATPIIHLIDEDVLAPVEAVRLINTKTMSYASNHSELWEDLTEDGIKPRKLLTNNYRDNYAIYENIVFARCVSYCLNYARHYNRLLSDIVFANNKLEIDLLQRENHLSYYLALGKLETGYIRSFADYSDIALKLIARMEFIISVLEARLKRPVYVQARKYKGKIKLRKTNILAMHKDYQKIYRFMKKIYGNDVEEIREDIDPKEYLYYCKLLTIFSIGHFNFQMPKDDKISFKKLNLKFSFKEYQLTVKDTKVDGHPALELTFFKDKEYKMLLVPSVDNIKFTSSEVETHVLSPEFETDDILVSINNIDSFRRIQQLLLKGMVYSSDDFDNCPFCGGKMIKENNIYSCDVCRTEIIKTHCEEENKDYFITGIKNYKLKPYEEELAKNKRFQKRMVEGLLHYRNITKITNDLSCVCPYCKKVHKIEKNEKQKS